MNLQGQTWLTENAAEVLDAVVDAIITIDQHGLMQSFNKATEALFGYPPEALLGQPVSMLMPEPHRSHHAGYVQQFLRSGQAQIIGIGRELTAVRADGREFPIYLAVSEVGGAEQRYFVGIIRDLSAQKAAEQALMEQQARFAHVGRLTTMGEMTASIAHEINQPLTAIAAYAQASQRLLAKPGTDVQRIADALDKLSQQALRAGDVIERIQRFMQDADSERALVNINDVLNEVESLAAGDARLHGVTLNLKLHPEDPKVICDAVQIQQVLLNLLRNAIDAMFEIDCRYGSEVTVRCAIAAPHLRIEVLDQGGGVSEDMAPKVFEAFHSSKRGGMGMGLSICRTILENHGGTLGYVNRDEQGADQAGACFYFQLPLPFSGDEGDADDVEEARL